MKNLLLFATVFFLFSFNANVLAQWNKINLPTDGELFMVRFADENTGWVVEENHIYKTTDGGISWIKQDSIYGQFKGSASLAAINSNTAFYSDYGYRGIRKTSDGGNTWYSVDSDSLYYGDIKFVDNNTGFAVGGYANTDSIGIVKKTTDGGESWEISSVIYAGSINGLLQNHIEGVSFIDQLNGWIVSYVGLVYKTSDGGVTWEFQDSIGHSNMFDWRPIRDIQFLDQSLGWAVGGLSFESSLCKTNNGGINWDIEHLTDLTHASLREILMIDSQTGWIVGSNNMPAYVAKTTDGGVTWIDETPDLTGLDMSGFESIAIKGNVGYIVGRHGIYKNTTTITSIDNEINNVYSFNLEQNYPNPFNPTTKIGYRISESGLVSLKLYDVLGNEIATLVNEVKSPGEYSINFNANDLSSGVYFYQIKVKDFVFSRKMILMK